MSQPPERNALGQPVGPALPHWIPARRPPRQVLAGSRVRLEPLDRLAQKAMADFKVGRCKALP